MSVLTPALPRNRLRFPASLRALAGTSSQNRPAKWSIKRSINRSINRPTKWSTSAPSADAVRRSHRILIIGGGAGGLELAVRLGKDAGADGTAEVVLVDASPAHAWKPLLHEVAAGTLSAGASENQIDFVQQAHKHHFHFQLGQLESLDRVRKCVWLAPLSSRDAGESTEIAPRRALDYDTLVLAIGAIDNDFGTPGVRQYAQSLNNLEQADHFHRRLLALCARSDLVAGVPVRVVIVGGGATGVELAAELNSAAGELAAFHGQLERLSALEWPLAITLIEASPRLLPGLAADLAQHVQAELAERAIDVRIGEQVREVDANGVILDNGERIDSDITVWAAGIQGQELARAANALDGLATNKRGQLVVRPTLQTTEDLNIFAIGDCADCRPWLDAPAVPPTAQAARQQAMLLARSLSERLAGKPPLAFIYKDEGSIIAIGREDAVANVKPGGGGGLRLSGRAARISYWLLQRRHLVILLGVARTALLTIGQWLSRRGQPRVKLH